MFGTWHITLLVYSLFRFLYQYAEKLGSTLGICGLRWCVVLVVSCGPMAFDIYVALTGTYAWMILTGVEEQYSRLSLTCVFNGHLAVWAEA